jgi:hypothetical protein
MRAGVRAPVFASEEKDSVRASLRDSEK